MRKPTARCRSTSSWDIWTGTTHCRSVTRGMTTSEHEHDPDLTQAHFGCQALESAAVCGAAAGAALVLVDDLHSTGRVAPKAILMRVANSATVRVRITKCYQIRWGRQSCRRARFQAGMSSAKTSSSAQPGGL